MLQQIANVNFLVVSDNALQKQKMDLFFQLK